MIENRFQSNRIPSCPYWLSSILTLGKIFISLLLHICLKSFSGWELCPQSLQFSTIEYFDLIFFLQTTKILQSIS